MPVAFVSQTLPRLAVLGLTAFVLAACVGGGNEGRRETSGTLAAPSTGVTAEALEPLSGGQPKVALILPLTAGDNAGTTGRSMKNAGEMALAEVGGGIQLIVKDDGGNSQGAAQAAQQAIAEGAELILGPLFAQGAAAAGQVARQAGVPVLAFSTDASVATSGVYLLSFLPQTDVDRIVASSVRSGRRSFAAIVPEDAYGSVVEGAFQEAAAKYGARVVALERYSSDKAHMQAAVQRVAQAAQGADAIFIPDSAPELASALASAGVDLKRAIPLGTGLWDDPQVLNSPALAGGLYAGPDSTGWQSFVQRYRGRYGEEPVRTATLAYDAVSLAAVLGRNQQGQRYTPQTLTNPSGFQGIDGIFRLKSNGLSERGLAILQVQPGGVKVVTPAPRSFAGSPGL